RRAADDGAEADDRVVGARVGQLTGHQRDLDRAGAPGHRHAVHVGVVAPEDLQRAVEQPLGDEGIEPAHHDGEARVAGDQAAFQELVHYALSVLRRLFGVPPPEAALRRDSYTGRRPDTQSGRAPSQAVELGVRDAVPAEVLVVARAHAMIIGTTRLDQPET